MPRDNQGRPPANNESRVEHNTKRPLERDPIDQARQDIKDKTRKLT